MLDDPPAGDGYLRQLLRRLRLVKRPERAPEPIAEVGNRIAEARDNRVGNESQQLATIPLPFRNVLGVLEIVIAVEDREPAVQALPTHRIESKAPHFLEESWILPVFGDPVPKHMCSAVEDPTLRNQLLRIQLPMDEGAVVDFHRAKIRGRAYKILV